MNDTNSNYLASSATTFKDVDDVATTTTSNENSCHVEVIWPYSIVPCVLIFIAGLIVIMASKFSFGAYKFFKKRNRKRSILINNRKPSKVQQMAAFMKLSDESLDLDEDVGKEGDVEDEEMNPVVKRRRRCTRLKLFFNYHLSSQSIFGKILFSFSCIFSVVSLIIYLIDASRDDPIEMDYLVTVRVTDVIDLICNSFFLLHFIMKFIAATDKLRFWIQLPSIADIFTIPSLVAAICLKRHWLGLRFVCVFRLLNFSDVLQALNILRTANHIRLVELFCLFLCVWIGSGGFIHLVENSGDPFYCYENANQITIWNSLYLVIITMSTVGYGDLTCTTVIGKVFIIIFVFGAIALFASSIPEIIEIVNQSRQKYLTEYKKEQGIKHLIVGGHISYTTIKNFVRDFMHDDRLNQTLKSVVLDENEPSLELESFFKRYYSKLTFVKGSLMVIKDLKNAKLSRAEVVLILTNQSTKNADKEDRKNIMMAVAVKNYSPNSRVILQLLKIESKTICKNLPFWTSSDHIICFTEMKMGFMAAGCLAPGFCTFLSNLLLMFSRDKKNQDQDSFDWQNEYLNGAEMEVYTEKFSPFFHGRPFPEVVIFCYVKLRLLLVAASDCMDSNNNISTKLILNPGSDMFVGAQTVGFFICTNETEAQSVLHFCMGCHLNIQAHLIKPCSCTTTSAAFQLLIRAQEHHKGRINSIKPNLKLDIDADSGQENELENKLDKDPQNKQEKNVDPIPKTQPPSLFQLSLMNSMQVNKSLPPSPLTRTVQGALDEECNETFDVTGYFYWRPAKSLDDCILKDDAGDLTLNKLKNHIILCLSNRSMGSLRSFILPLRSSSLKVTQIHTIVIVTEDRSDLEKEWRSIRNFPRIFVKIASPLSRAVLRSICIERCYLCVVHSSQFGDSSRGNGSDDDEDSTNDDSMALLITLNIKNMTFNNVSLKYNSPAFNLLHKQFYMRKESGISAADSYNSLQILNSIPLLTELMNDENVQFIDQDDDDDPETPFYLTQPFACGRVFASRVLDALSTTVIFNPETYNLIRLVVTGTDSEEHDFLLAEGFTEQSYQLSNDKLASIRNRCRLNLLPINKGILKGFANKTYKEMFEKALSEHGILCIGLYRLINVYLSTNSDPNNRFVIVNPSPDIILNESDKVYCLCPHMFFE